MSKRTTIRLVPTLQKDLSELAEEMGISYNQLVNYALVRRGSLRREMTFGKRQ